MILVVIGLYGEEAVMSFKFEHALHGNFQRAAKPMGTPLETEIASPCRAFIFVIFASFFSCSTLELVMPHDGSRVDISRHAPSLQFDLEVCAVSMINELSIE
jgi:hypothetical protein